MPYRVGFIGLGNMGSVMAARLLEAGHALWVHNRTPQRADPLLRAGAQWSPSPAAMAEQVELLITMVADDAALTETTLGPNGALAQSRGGLTLADMSTVSPEASATVAAAAAAADIPYLRAPVTGSTTLARTGDLGILVSGPKDSLTRYSEVFSVLGRRIFHLGDGEEARVMKLALNTVVAGSMLSFGEALVLGERSGLDWPAMLDVFSDSAVGSPLVRYKSASLERRDFTAAFTTEMMAKDLDLALDLARRSGATMPTTAMCRELLQATAGMGWGDRDFSAAVMLFERLSEKRLTNQ